MCILSKMEQEQYKKINEILVDIKDVEFGRISFSPEKAQTIVDEVAKKPKIYPPFPRETKARSYNMGTELIWDKIKTKYGFSKKDLEDMIESFSPFTPFPYYIETIEDKSEGDVCDNTSK